MAEPNDLLRNIGAPTSAAAAASFEVRYHQVASQLVAAKAEEAALREQLDQLKRQLHSQHEMYESQLTALREEVARLQQAVPAVPAPAARAPGEVFAGFVAAATTPSSEFASVWLAEQRYNDVCSHFHALLYPSHGFCDVPDLAYFWRTIGGAEVWFKRHSASTLSLLLSREERSWYCMSKDYTDAEKHQFLEHVIARLPCLRHLSLNGYAYTFDADANPAVLPGFGSGGKPFIPFRAVQTLDVSKCSTLTAAQLLKLGKAMQALKSVDVTGCESLTWADVCALNSGRLGPIAVTPSTEAEFEASKDKQYVDRVAEEFIVGQRTPSRLLDMWRKFGANGWREGMTPKRLTAILAKSDVKTVIIGGVLGADVMSNAHVPSSEMKSFVSNFLSRLPQLEKLVVHRCECGWPLDFAALASVAGTGMDTAFPALKHLSVRHTKWQPEDLVKTIQTLPALENNMASPNSSARDCAMACEVHIEDGPAGVDVVELRQACDRKLYIWAN